MAEWLDDDNARCLGLDHDQTGARRVMQITEMRLTRVQPARGRIATVYLDTSIVCTFDDAMKN